MYFFYYKKLSKMYNINSIKQLLIYYKKQKRIAYLSTTYTDNLQWEYIDLFENIYRNQLSEYMRNIVLNRRFIRVVNHNLKTPINRVK